MRREFTEKIISGDRKIHLNIATSQSQPVDYPTVIFLPPAGCHSYMPISFIKKFTKRGYNFIGLDYPGHGKSEGPAGHFTIEEIVKAVMKAGKWATDQFGEGLGILATSMGGFIGCYTLLNQERWIKEGKLEKRRFTSAVIHSLAFCPDDVWAYCRFPLFYKSLRKIYIPLVSSVSANFLERFPVFDLSKYRIMFIPFFMRPNPGQRSDWERFKRLFTWGIDWLEDPLTLSFYTLGACASLTGTQPPAKPEDIPDQVSVKVLIATGDGMVSPEFIKSRYHRIGTQNKELETVKGTHFFINSQPEMAAQTIGDWFDKTLK